MYLIILQVEDQLILTMHNQRKYNNSARNKLYFKTVAKKKNLGPCIPKQQQNMGTCYHFSEPPDIVKKALIFNTPTQPPNYLV